MTGYIVAAALAAVCWVLWRKWRDEAKARRAAQAAADRLREHIKLHRAHAAKLTEVRKEYGNDIDKIKAAQTDADALAAVRDIILRNNRKLQDD